MTSLLDSALELAASGVAVFPCGADKSPRTPNGHKDATTDPEVIRAWGNKFEMIGAPVPPGQIVIDVDPRNGGDDTLAAFKTAGLELPATKRVRTGGGGTHIYLTADEPERLNAKLGPGVDVKRAGKGYVIVPPSPGYKQFAFVEPAPMPSWLADVLAGASPKPGESLPATYFEQFQKGSKYGLAALQRQIGTIAMALEGERNDTLYKAAVSLARLVAGGEIDEDETREQLAQAALKIGLEPDEIAGTIESAWEAGIVEPRRAPEQPVEQESGSVPFTVALPDGEDDESTMWTDWQVDEPEPPWYVKPFLPRNAYVLVYGATEASKSMVWNGIGAELSHHGHRVSVYSLENPPHTDRDRLRRLQPSKSHFRLTNRVLDLNDTRQLEALMKRERSWGTDVIIFDTYSHAFNSHSDDGNAKAIDFARRVRWLMQCVGCSVVVIDHTGYVRDDEPRDASAKRQQVDVAILMRKVGQWAPGQSASFIMENKKAARFGNPFVVNGQIKDTKDGLLEIVWSGKTKIEWEAA